ncbi:MAG: hypothetical protein AAFX87_19470 [Bacteroidota bacterium]
MQSFWFWKNWEAPYKQVYQVLLVLFGALVIYAAVAYFAGASWVIHWETSTETEEIKIPVDVFQKGLFNLTVVADNHLIFERFEASNLTVNVTAAYLYLIVITVALVLLLSVLPSLSRFWFIVGMTLLIAFIVNIKLELLILFGGLSKALPIATLVLYLGTSFFFHAIKSHLSFLTRLVTFTVLTLLLALVIYFFSEVNNPFLYIVAYGMTGPVILSLLFILLIAHEIVASFIAATTNHNTQFSTKSMRHFFLITLVYLGYLVITYLNETNAIDWDILYFNLFLLMLISTVVGIWGYKQREPQYEKIMAFYPWGALFYLAMAVIAFATLSFFFATANDPIIEVFKDAVIYGHLGFGGIFVIYIIANFIGPLAKNMQVYKVLYKPNTMPFFTFRLGGVIAVIALVTKSSFDVPLFHAQSGYYNALGDLYTANREYILAEGYYDLGRIYGLANHRSNYALASIAEKRDNMEKAVEHYALAIERRPTEFAYANLSNLYLDNNQFFEAKFILQDGLEQFPASAVLRNNLGLIYNRTSLIDSTIIFLREATDFGVTEDAGGANFIGTLAKNEILLNADSIASEYGSRSHLPALNNTLVTRNQLGDSVQGEFVFRDSLLSTDEAVYLYNRTFNSIFTRDTLEAVRTLSYAQRPENLLYKEPLHFIVAMSFYYNQAPNKAFDLLEPVAYGSPSSSGYYLNTLGLWAAEQDAWDKSLVYFRNALDRGYADAQLNYALALLETGDLEYAREVWGIMEATGSEFVKLAAKDIVHVLSTNDNELSNFEDAEYYYYNRFLLSAQDSLEFVEVLDRIENSDLKARAILDMAEKQYEKGDLESAILYYRLIEPIRMRERTVFDRAQFFELKLLAAKNDIRGLSAKINQGIAFGEDRTFEKYFYTGLINEASGDTTNAWNNYEQIVERNAFFIEGMIAASNFLDRKQVGSFEAYDVLQQALERNPGDINLQKLYIIQCARLGLQRYAEYALDELKNQLSEEEFVAFYGLYEQEYALWEEREATAF